MLFVLLFNKTLVFLWSIPVPSLTPFLPSNLKIFFLFFLSRNKYCSLVFFPNKFCRTKVSCCLFKNCVLAVADEIRRKEINGKSHHVIMRFKNSFKREREIINCERRKVKVWSQPFLNVSSKLLRACVRTSEDTFYHKLTFWQF